MKRLLLVGVILLFLPTLVYGQAKVGTAGAQFLEIGVSARAVGMGEAFLAISDDASALYYNPAGLVQLNQLELIAAYIDYPAGINYGFFGLAYPSNNLGGVWGVSFSALSTGDIPWTTYYDPMGDMASEYSSNQTFVASEYALGLSYGASLTDRFSVGLTFKFINESYESETATGWAMDVGTLYDTGFRGFKIAMVISNFGPDLRFIEMDYPLPMNFKFGGSMDIINNGSHKATFGLEGSHPSDNLEKFNGGLEYCYNKLLTLRVGNHFEHDAGGFSAGAGLNIKMSQFKLGFDYAYHDFGYLSEIHRFSVNMKF